MKANKLLVAALFCVAAVPAQTVNHFYIDAVNGDDMNPGTMAQPFQSLSWALNRGTANIHIHVLPGVYSPTTTGDFWDSTTMAPARFNLLNYQNLKITGVDRDTCIFDFGAGDGPWGFININTGCVDIEISHLTMRNAGVDPWGNGAIAVDNGAQTVDIHNCYFEQTYSTLIVWGGYDVAFHDNVITDAVPNTGAWPSVGIRVRTNVTKGDRTYIYNNTFYAIGQGISWSNDANNPQQWIANNLCLDITAKAYPNSVYAGAHIVFENNLAFNSATWNYDPVIGPNGTGPVLSATNLEVDPMLANPVAGDYAPLAGSPCIEGGSSSTHPFILNDYFDNNRAVDADENGIAIPDIGAIEATDISMEVTNFGQGQIANFDIQSPNPTAWAFGALMISFSKAPAYNPWWGVSGPNLYGLLGTMVGFPGVPQQMLIPTSPALDGVSLHTQFVGLKINSTAWVLKATGTSSNLL